MSAAMVITPGRLDLEMLRGGFSDVFIDIALRIDHGFIANSSAQTSTSYGNTVFFHGCLPINIATQPMRQCSCRVNRRRA